MAVTLPYRLILASGSAGRRYLLERAGYSFEVKPSHAEEPTQARYGSCRQYVQEVAWLKAAAAAEAAAAHEDRDGYLLAADTVGWIDGEVIGKPDDRDHAGRIIRQLAGRDHELWTGVCLWRLRDGLQFQYQEQSIVRMAPLSPEEVESYLETRRWEGCSGAYAILEEHDPYLTVITGSTTNVIGLPMESLGRLLSQLPM
jgi:septum formation protein